MELGVKKNPDKGQRNLLKVASSGDLYWERIHQRLIANTSFDFSKDDFPQDVDKKVLDPNRPFESDCSIFKPGFDGFDEIVPIF